MNAFLAKAIQVVAVLALVASDAGANEDIAQDVHPPRISLELRDADVREVLRMVSQQGDIDVVMSDQVTGNVTLNLSEATVTEALDALMAVSGLAYTDHGSIVTVSTLKQILEQRQMNEEFIRKLEAAQMEEVPSTEVRLFHLRYVDAERVISLITSVLSEDGKVSQMQTSDHVAQARGTSGAADGESDMQIGGRLSTTSVGEPARSHTLVVVDTPAIIEEVAQIIAEVDVKPVQVLIEARFVEMVLGKDDRLGVDWNAVVYAAGAAAPHTFPFGGTSFGEWNPSVAGGGASGVFPDAPASVTTPSAAGLFTFGVLDFTAFTALLEMISKDSRANIVSNPHVLVRDRSTATILVGERFPILSTTVTDQGTVTEELERYEPIGVQLEVTPSVLGDENVELIVRPSTSTLGPLVEGSTGIMVARINTRQIDTMVWALDGQTVVLGGLISTRSTEVEKRVPFLSALPWVGEAFTHTDTIVERVDLVVFLTVSVVKEQGLTESQRRLFEATDYQLADPEQASGDDWWSELDFTESQAQH